VRRTAIASAADAHAQRLGKPNRAAVKPSVRRENLIALCRRGRWLVRENGTASEPPPAIALALAPAQIEAV
jgi:hypothetical protein